MATFSKSFSILQSLDYLRIQAGKSRIRFPIRSLNFFNLLNPSNSTMALGLTQSLTEMSTRKRFLGVKRGWSVRLTTLQPSVSRLSIQCEILSISQTYSPPRSVTGIALLFNEFVISKYWKFLKITLKKYCQQLCYMEVDPLEFK
jgi:hypothetical protein